MCLDDLLALCIQITLLELTDCCLQVYKSDPFPGLSLGAQYAVTVMALPVPEEWERFYHSEIFSTRCKAARHTHIRAHLHTA